MFVGNILVFGMYSMSVFVFVFCMFVWLPVITCVYL